MNFFTIVKGKLIVAPEVLANPPLKKVYDKHGDNGLLYVWYLCVPSNNPYYALPEEERNEKLKKLLGLKRDKLIDAAIEEVEEWIDKAGVEIIALKESKEFIERSRVYFKNVDLDEKTKMGYLMHKPSEIIKGVQELLSQSKAIDTRLTEISKEMDNVRIGTGGRQINDFEDGHTIKRRPLGK